MAKYSICMTCFNEHSTVRDSLKSLIDQLDDGFEVVVVDNFSADGTYESLLEFEPRGVKVLRSKCSRGRGREIAFEKSSGEYVIANLDLDDVFLPVIKEVVAEYHRRAEGSVFAAFNSPPGRGSGKGWSQNMTIGPRSIISSIGGWRDLDVYEDWDLWSRASIRGSYRWTSFRFVKNGPSTAEPKRMLSRFTARYRRYRSRLRLGLGVFAQGEKQGASQRLAYTAARLVSRFRGRLSGQDPRFDSFNSDYYVEVEGAQKREETPL